MVDGRITSNRGLIVPNTLRSQLCEVILVYRYRRRRGYTMMMDKASLALAQGLAEGVPKSMRAIADRWYVSLSTLHPRARGGESLETKA